MTRKLLGVAAAVAMTGCATVEPMSAASTQCDGSAEANRAIVLAFYNEGLVNRQPDSAFRRYMVPDFVEHKPDVPEGTRDATATFLSQIMTDVPDASWKIIGGPTRCATACRSCSMKRPKPPAPGRWSICR